MADDSRSDQELIDAIGQGDAAAFESLYRRHREWVLRLAIRLGGGDPNTALDVLQETFLYVLRKLCDDTAERFQLTGQFTSFLYPAVKHIAIRQRERSRRMGPIDGVDPQARPQPHDATADIEAVLVRLPEEHREVVMLRFVDGLSLEEIAAALAVPVGTVKSRLHHALRKLRDDPATKKFFEP